MTAADQVDRAARLFDEAMKAHRQAVKYSIRLDPLDTQYWRDVERLRGELLDLVHDLATVGSTTRDP